MKIEWFLNTLRKSMEHFITTSLNDVESNLFNWEVISNKPLSSEFINRHYKLLQWPIMSKVQAFDLDTLKKFDHLVDFALLSINPNLSDEIVEEYLSRMDWKKVQQYHKFSAALLQKHSENLDKPIIFEFQKLDQLTIDKLLGDEPLDEYLKLVFTHQKVSEQFILKYGSNFYPIIIEHQTLSNSFIDKIDSAQVLHLLIQYQRLSADFITKHCNVLTLKSIIKYQELSREQQYQIFPLLNGTNFDATTHDIKLLKKFVKYQSFDENVWIVILNNLPKDKTLDNTLDKLYAIILFRIENEELPKLEDFEQRILPLVDWEYLSNMEMSDDVVEKMITKYPDLIPWYHFIQTHELTEEQIHKIENHLKPIDWWLLLTKYSYSRSFMRTHKDKLNWWKYIEPTELAAFYKQCIEAITFSELTTEQESMKAFLDEFVKKADWKHILRYEELDEWFMRIFSHFDINLYWWKLSVYQKLTMKFIRKYLANMDLKMLLKYQRLDRAFLDEVEPFFDDEARDLVSKHQT